MSRASGRPEKTENLPYYNRYIDLVSGDDAATALEKQLAEALAFYKGIDESTAGSSYEPGKWTVKQVLGHILDTERVMTYRAMSFARNDQTELPGFEQDDFIEGANFDSQQMTDLVKEFEYLRKSNIMMFRGLTDEAWRRTGRANGAVISVRALAFVLAGHELHHRGIIRDRYLKAVASSGAR